MTRKLDCFLKPKSVAILGASTKIGPGHFNTLEVMKMKGYRGKIYPVNPKAKEILGIKSYPSILDIPEEVELAIILTGRDTVPELVRQCIQKPVQGIIIITQGFADADAKGKELQEEVLNLLAGTEIRMLGPNTMGVVNNIDSFATLFVDVPTKYAPVGIICQSGLFVGSHADIFQGAAYGIDIANAADLGFNEILDFFGRQKQIEVINLYMEGIRGGKEFIALCKEITKEKPIVVYKTGRCKEGAQAISSHSGSLAGEDHVYQAAFQKAGVIRADSFDELRDFNKTFLKYKHVAGNRVAVITFTGGGGIAVLDAMVRCGLVPAKFSPETISSIEKIFPDWLAAGNPLDLWLPAMTLGPEKVYPPLLEKVLADPGVDMLVFLAGDHQPFKEDYSSMETYVLKAAAKYPHKPVAIWNVGLFRHQTTEYIESRKPIAMYSSPERLARALGALYHYYHNIHHRAKTAAPGAAGSPGGHFTLPGQKDGKGILLGGEAMEVFRRAGLSTVREKEARDLTQAIKAAQQIGYPLVMKVISPQIIHKTETGGIALDIRDEAGLKAAYRSIMAAVMRKAPQAEVEGVLLQQYLPGGIELLLGGKRDDEFGPVLVFGLGGIYTEILQDVAFRIAPVEKSEALEMIKETKSFLLLKGARGKEGADLEAVAQVIIVLSELMVNNPAIKEVDINPLLATPQGAIILDSRIILDR